jgi:hypothetical protein
MPAPLTLAATVRIVTLDDPAVTDNAELFDGDAYLTVDLDGNTDVADHIDPDDELTLEAYRAVLVEVAGKVIAASYMPAGIAWHIETAGR